MVKATHTTSPTGRISTSEPRLQQIGPVLSEEEKLAIDELKDAYRKRVYTKVDITAIEERVMSELLLNMCRTDFIPTQQEETTHMQDTSNETPTAEELADEGQSAALASAAKSEEFQQKVLATVDQILSRNQGMEDGLSAEIEEARNDGDIVRLARCYLYAREAVENLEASFKSLKARFQKLADVELPEDLDKSPLKNIPLADEGYTVGVTVRTKASVKSGLKDRAIEYLRADKAAVEGLIGSEEFDVEKTVNALKLIGRTNELAQLEQVDFKPSAERRQALAEHIVATTKGLDTIVVDHVFPQTLSSLAKSLAEEGEELPEDIFTTFEAPTTSRRKLSS